MVILIAAQLCIICEKLRAKTSRPLYYCFLFFFWSWFLCMRNVKIWMEERADILFQIVAGNKEVAVLLGSWHFNWPVQ